MIAGTNSKLSLLTLPILLSAIHVVLFLTTVSFQKAASNGNPLFCVDLPVSLPLVARDDVGTVVGVGFLATAWWYFIGWIGQSNRRGKIGQTGSVVGVVLILLICAGDSYAMISQFLQILRQPNFSAVDIVIYIFAVALLSGGVISGALAARATFRSAER